MLITRTHLLFIASYTNRRMTEQALRDVHVAPKRILLPNEVINLGNKAGLTSIRVKYDIAIPARGPSAPRPLRAAKPMQYANLESFRSGAFTAVHSHFSGSYCGGSRLDIDTIACLSDYQNIRVSLA
ncbi:hypothetical protein TcasGA2_TC009274 [Tribolium castaneum]|uniref:Uncharacterized protein n=1 Tax=Tribolium castaneum TaxID=7070 RepID=D6WSB0_TRICA|nr:hypothetical protein TcasGA2_TC009274 [Tribolium castaneum]